MAVRIYDLAKGFGVESTEVIAKAKELGMAQAEVPSSNLDKIAAEFRRETIYPTRAIGSREALLLGDAAKVQRENAGRQTVVAAVLLVLSLV